MARRSKIDLTDFTRWVQVDEFKKKETAHVYACNTRKVLSAVDTIDEETLTEYFKKLHEAGTTRYYAQKSAWTIFCRWAKDARGMELPQPMRTEVIRTPDILPLPPEVQTSLYRLIAKPARSKGEGLGLSPEVIALLKWGDFEPSFPTVGYREVKHPTDFRRRIRIPKAWLVALEEYAQPDESGQTPFIPSSPGGSKPYPIKALQREYKSYKQLLSRS
jgi:hypothetical protein